MLTRISRAQYNQEVKQLRYRWKLRQVIALSQIVVGYLCLTWCHWQETARLRYLKLFFQSGIWLWSSILMLLMFSVSSHHFLYLQDKTERNSTSVSPLVFYFFSSVFLHHPSPSAVHSLFLFLAMKSSPELGQGTIIDGNGIYIALQERLMWCMCLTKLFFCSFKSLLQLLMGTRPGFGSPSWMGRGSWDIPISVKYSERTSLILSLTANSFIC